MTAPQWTPQDLDIFIPVPEKDLNRHFHASTTPIEQFFGIKRSSIEYQWTYPPYALLSLVYPKYHDHTFKYLNFIYLSDDRDVITKFDLDFLKATLCQKKLVFSSHALLSILHSHSLQFHRCLAKREITAQHIQARRKKYNDRGYTIGPECTLHNHCNVE